MTTTPEKSPGYPVTLLLEGRSCLVVGGGRVAERKVAGLLTAGAVVTVVAPDILPTLRALPVCFVERAYVPGDLTGRWLVVTATGSPSVDRLVHDHCEQAGIFVNAADDIEGCSLFLPAVLRRGPVSVAVSTDGRSPVLAGVLRDAIAQIVGPGTGRVATLLGWARDDLHDRGRSTEGLPWRPLVERLLAETASGQRDAALAEAVSEWLAEVAADDPRSGPRAQGE